MQAIDERRPGLLVERLPLAAAGASEGLNHVRQVAAPRLGRLIVTIDADHGEAFGKLAAPDEIVERRHDEAFGQIAGGAENHHGRRGRPAAGEVVGRAGERAGIDHPHKRFHRGQAVHGAPLALASGRKPLANRSGAYPGFGYWFGAVSDAPATLAAAVLVSAVFRAESDALITSCFSK